MGKREEEMFMVAFVMALFISILFNIGSNFLFEVLKTTSRPQDYFWHGWLFIGVGMFFSFGIFWELKQRGYFKK